jgi:hypothetical protein
MNVILYSFLFTDLCPHVCMCEGYTVVHLVDALHYVGLVPSDHTVALGLTQFLTEMSTRVSLGVKVVFVKG